MSERIIEFFWDVSSPFTYLASTQIERVASVCNVSVKWRPFLLGGVFRDTGNQAPANIPAKGAYMLDDLKTWAEYYKVPFCFPENFPLNSILPMRAAIGADRLGKGKDFAIKIMNLYWVEGIDPSVPENMTAAVHSIGLDGAKLLQMTQDPEIKEALKGNSGEAVNRGAFGAPTFFVGKKMFWGNDRLTLLEAYLKREI